VPRELENPRRRVFRDQPGSLDRGTLASSLFRHIESLRSASMDFEWRNAIRRKLTSELARERALLEDKADSAEKQAQHLAPSGDTGGDRKFALEVEARQLRARARQLSKQWAALVFDEMYEFY
jgi:hypothetical protein